MEYLKAKRIPEGATAGILAPAYAFSEESFEKAAAGLRSIGLRAKPARNCFRATYGYAATPDERAADFREMLLDDEADFLLFGGGEVANEILPLLDFDLAAKARKPILSYSDSTTLLNPITRATGLITYYGQSPRTFFEPNAYNMASFRSVLMEGAIPVRENAAEWKTIRPGVCEGRLVGGYLVNFAVLLNGGYFPLPKGEKRILFLEDSDMFSPPAVVSKFLSHISQSGLMDCVTGLLFGHYAQETPAEIDEILARFADLHGIPAARCEDYGHGTYNSLMPIGLRARMDTAGQNLAFLESAVE